MVATKAEEKGQWGFVQRVERLSNAREEEEEEQDDGDQMVNVFMFGQAYNVKRKFSTSGSSAVWTFKGISWVFTLRLNIRVFFNHSCVFPFVYGEVTHYGCTSVHSDFAWCSLDETFQGRWRYCTGADPPKCTFPFLFGKKLINRCTREGYALSRSWCSLTKDYNRDKKWKQCSPYNV
ncbi:binder of sperm protein homolog 2-like [Camelus ferus]|uniref:Binder of sperm protein homolog 2-like n=1 Tax=Camelus ferus TaxID=419612 RepID=A0A8B8TM15_CAMFR|nr:binder of sperm protein homolog 2-like [Camelus ferus]